jgi:CubicO group peptidase (beta-lactamase class C family)
MLAAVLSVTLWAAAGCTTYRIVRYREPSATNLSMFPTRAVSRAPEPFRFAERPTRTGLDTLQVRAPDGSRMTWAAYMERYRVLAFLVVVNDTIVYETYRDGHAASKPLITFSASKSVLSALLGIAIGEGKIQSLDDPVARYIPALRGKPAYDGVTLRHLLAMRSGLRFTTLGNGMWADLRSDEAHFYYTTNLPKRMASMPRDHEPGSRWVYKDVDAEVLGWALSNAVGMPVARYLEEKIWHPIGAEYDASWSLDSRDGQEFVASGLNATARDLAKFGQLFLNGGKWGDRQVVPAGWARASASIDSSRAEPDISNWWKMQHHFYWWHPLQPPHGDFYADGSNGERIYVDPATRTVIVQLANESNQDFPFRRIAAYFAGRGYEYPRSIPALLRLAGLHSADSVRLAYATLNAALRAAPERYVITASGMNAVGMLLLDSAATRAAAIEVFRLTVEHYPDRVEGYLNLATAYARTGDAARAREVLDRAAERFPNDPEVRRRRVGP